MAKSYKHFPAFAQEKNENHFYNRKVRHNKFIEFSTPSAYRKIFFQGKNRTMWTENDVIKQWNATFENQGIKRYFNTLEEALTDYRKSLKK